MLKVVAILRPSSTPPSASICSLSAASWASSTKILRSPASLKSTCAAQKVAEWMRVVAGLRHIGEGGAEQRAADAIADHIGIAHAGRLLDRVERGEDALAHIVFEGFVVELAVGIDPGDDEHGVALADQPFDEGILRAQIQDVELVDPGRKNQQRPLVDLGGRRRVLQQLEQFAAEHDLARRQRDILADHESVGALPDRKLALAALQIGEQIVEARAPDFRRWSAAWRAGLRDWSGRNWSARSRRRTAWYRNRRAGASPDRGPRHWRPWFCSQFAVSRYDCLMKSKIWFSCQSLSRKRLSAGLGDATGGGVPPSMRWAADSHSTIVSRQSWNCASTRAAGWAAMPRASAVNACVRFKRIERSVALFQLTLGELRQQLLRLRARLASCCRRIRRRRRWHRRGVRRFSGPFLTLFVLFSAFA